MGALERSVFGSGYLIGNKMRDQAQVFTGLTLLRAILEDVEQKKHVQGIGDDISSSRLLVPSILLYLIGDELSCKEHGLRALRDFRDCVPRPKGI